MEALTVMQLYNILADLIAIGKGNRVVLVPNQFDEDIDADYRTIGQVDSENDIQQKYIYLETNSSEFENEYFAEGE